MEPRTQPLNWKVLLAEFHSQEHPGCLSPGPDMDFPFHFLKDKWNFLIRFTWSFVSHSSIVRWVVK